MGDGNCDEQYGNDPDCPGSPNVIIIIFIRLLGDPCSIYNINTFLSIIFIYSLKGRERRMKNSLWGRIIILKLQE